MSLMIAKKPKKIPINYMQSDPRMKTQWMQEVKHVQTMENVTSGLKNYTLMTSRLFDFKCGVVYQGGISQDDKSNGYRSVCFLSDLRTFLHFRPDF